MGQDFRFALRMIWTHRWFSAAVMATLAFGIGLNTMVFTLVDAVLFKPVPVPGGDRLVAILSHDLNSTTPNRSRMPVSWPDFLDYRAHTGSMAALEAGAGDGAILSETGISPQRYNMFRVSPGFFRMLHISPVRGRDFAESDSKSAAAPVALLGYSIWKDRYGSRDVIGRSIRVNGNPATIVGIMPEGFRFPSEEDLWMPLQENADLQDRAHRSLQLFGILKPGVTLQHANADLDVVSRRLAAEYPSTDKGMAAVVQTFHQRYNGDQIQLVFSLMMAAVGFVLLIACANIANMLLGRALSRRREISIRAAMGASRWQLVRQLLVESLVLSTLGGAAGLLLAATGVHYFDLATRDVGKPYWVQFAMDLRVFAYFAIVCVASALAFGLVPALRSSRDIGAAIKDGTRAAGTRHGGKLSSTLVVFQFGLTVVLLLGAGMFMRTFVEKQKMNPWIPGSQIVTGRINFPEEHYKDEAVRRRFYDRLLPRIEAIPSVSQAAIVSDLPSQGSGSRHFEIEGAPVRDPEHGPAARVVVTSPGYFSAIHMPILRGRGFNAADGAEKGLLRAVVTRDFAERTWGSADPVGKRFRFFEKKKPGDWISVIGVSGNIEQSLEQNTDPLLFLPYRQNSYDSMALVVRAANPPAVASALRSAVQEIDQDLPVFDVRSLDEVVEKQIWFLRLFGTVFAVFASIGLVIASVGIYAVMAQATGSRTQEIGVRMALGATPARIIALILRRGVGQLAAGLALGIAVAIPVTRVLGKLQFLDVPAAPAILLSVVALLCGVGVFACWLPARRAAAMNPVSAIRND